MTEDPVQTLDQQAQLAGRSGEEARRAVEPGDQIAALETQLAARSAVVARLDAALAAARSQVADLETKLAQRAAEAVRLDAELVRARDHAGLLARELEVARR